MKNIKKICYLSISILMCGFIASLSGTKISHVQAKADAPTTIDNEVAGINIIPGYNPADSFLLFTLKTSDYDFSYNGGNDYPLNGKPGYFTPAHKYRDYTNFFSNLKFNGAAFTIDNTPAYFTYKANKNTLAININGKLGTLNEGDYFDIPKGTTFPTYGFVSGDSTKTETLNAIYTIPNDTRYTYINGAFRCLIDTNKVATEVTALKTCNAYSGSDKFLLLSFSVDDYNDPVLMSKDYNNGNDFNLLKGAQVKISFKNCSNFSYKIKVNDSTINLDNEFIYINYRANRGIGIRFTEKLAALKDLDTITFPKGTTFPSFNISIDNNRDVYEVQEDTVFTYYSNEFHICHAEDGSEFDHDETAHWHYCDVCAQQIDYHTHNIITDHKDPTCTEEGFDECEYCEDCGYVKKEGNPISPLGHDLVNGDYLVDEEYHWKECTHGCGTETQKEGHNWGDDHKTCTYCGYVRDVKIITVNGGYVSDGLSEVAYKTGSEITVIADTPARDMMFEGWYINDAKVSKTATYTFELVSDTVITAKFVTNPNPLPDPTIETKTGNNMPLIIGLSAGGGVLVLGGVGVCLYLFVFKKKHI